MSSFGVVLSLKALVAERVNTLLVLKRR